MYWMPSFTFGLYDQKDLGKVFKSFLPWYRALATRGLGRCRASPASMAKTRAQKRRKTISRIPIGVPYKMIGLDLQQKEDCKRDMRSKFSDRSKVGWNPSGISSNAHRILRGTNPGGKGRRKEAHWSVQLMSRLYDQGKGALALRFSQGSGERRAHEQLDKADIDVQEWENQNPQRYHHLSKREAHTFFLALVFPFHRKLHAKDP